MTIYAEDRSDLGLIKSKGPLTNCHSGIFAGWRGRTYSVRVISTEAITN